MPIRAFPSCAEVFYEIGLILAPLLGLAVIAGAAFAGS